MKQDKIQAQAEINKIKHILINKYKPEKIILFGSYAWGKPNRDSDLDFLVIKHVDKPRPSREQDIYSLLMRYFKNRQLPVDVIVHTPKETEERMSIGDPFIKDILTRGKIIYEGSK